MLKLYNSLTRKIEDFKPVHPDSLNVGMYTCGPTVYDFAHIGNFRTYTTSDLLLRTLQYNGYTVDFIMNLTDVGHLTGDNLGDADMGEDRMEKSAKKEGKSAWEVAEFYSQAFLKDYDALNLTKPILFAKATDHIKEQIDLVKKLEEKGFAYTTSDGVYFDTSRFKDYGKLSDLDQIKEGARVEVNEEKRNPRDFALWKFSHPHGRSFDSAQAVRGSEEPSGSRRDDDASRRQMEWDSPWGRGFPGWHIECSAMAMKYLGESFDVHIGGIDLRSTHHPNEIAQAEAVTHKQFVKYWVHSAFMLVKGERMSKSLGNNYKLYDLQKEARLAEDSPRSGGASGESRRGYDPIALRYLYLQTHYRQEMNFTFASLEAAQTALNRLREEAVGFGAPSIGCAEFEQRFLEAINDDLNMPKAVAVMWELMKSDYPDTAKAQSLYKMDEVLGLDLKNAHKYIAKKLPLMLPQEVKDLLAERDKLRKGRQYNMADQLRKQINLLGFEVVDTEKGTEVKKLDER